MPRVGTVAFARWVAGGGPDEARAVGRDAWVIFGRLAAERAAPLSEATKRCLMWRDSVADSLEAAAPRLHTPPAALSEALGMLQRSLDVTLVRMCESFEDERERMHEELAERQRELAYQATHDALTGLPNRALILDRVEQMLSRSRRAELPVAVLFIDLDNFKGINDTLGHSVRRPAAARRRRAAERRCCARATRSAASAATSSSCWPRASRSSPAPS